MKKSTLIFCSFLATLILISCGPEEKNGQIKPNQDSTILGSQNHKTKSGNFEPPDSNYTGDYFEKYASGIIKVRGYFRFGKRSGKWMYFYPDGKVWSEAFFDNNKMNGESNVYHPNGKLMYSGHYNMDKADSLWQYYDTLGKLIEKRDYRIDQKKK